MKKLFSTTAILMAVAFCAVLAQKPKTKATAKPATAQAKPVAEAAEELVPVTPEKGKEVVAIYPFTTSGYTYYDYALNAGTAVEAGFVRSKRFTVVERSRFGVIQKEDLFQEANTQEIVKKAMKLGAKIVVTGHVIAATNGTEGQKNILGGGVSYKYIAQLSLSFKIIDVQTGEITKSETILGKGKGATPAEAMQGSYEDIDRMARIYVAEYLPQRFEYASEVEVDSKNRLKKFKIWGGSDQGLKEKDLVEIYRLSYTVSPKGKKIEEKKLLGTAKVIEINSTESSTCELQRSGDIGESLLSEIKTKPESIVFEYKGTAKQKGLFGL
jgi:curli biogenesis system outer membrane secretion channel CsgG